MKLKRTEEEIREKLQDIRLNDTYDRYDRGYDDGRINLINWLFDFEDEYEPL